MGALSLSFFSTSVRVSRFKKIPRNNISCQFENISHFNLFAAGFEFPIMDKFFVCIVFAGMIVTTVSGRPTEEEESDGTQMLSPYLDGTVVEGRPKETIEKDGTISLEFESPEIEAKWLRQEDRRRKGLPLTTMPTTTTTSGEPTMWNPENVFVNCWMC